MSEENSNDENPTPESENPVPELLQGQIAITSPKTKLHDPTADLHELLDGRKEFRQEGFCFVFGEVMVKSVHDEKRAGRGGDLLRISLRGCVR